MPPELDADVSATLTQEELDAINAEDTPEEKMIMRQAPDGEDGDDDDGDGDQGDDDQAGSAPAADTPAAPATDADTGPEQPEQTKEAAGQRYEAELPSDYDDQIQSLKSRDAELRQQFKDGEIDIDARDTGLAELTEQREQLLVARAKAEISQEMSQQSAQQQWQRTINTFMADAAKGEGAIDYRKDEAKAADLDQFVKILANRPENNDKAMDWFLQEAHKRVLALHGVKAPAPTPAADPKKTVADAVNKRKTSASTAPATLAQVPGGDGPGDVGSEFADVLSLDGQAYEDAIARMTPAQRERFLREG